MRSSMPLSNRVAAVLGQLAARLAPAAPRSAAPPAVPQLPAAESCPVAKALFADALQANSNRELDWLWLATRLVGSEERRYCFLKALAINPRSQLAADGLRTLDAAHSRT